MANNIRSTLFCFLLWASPLSADTLKQSTQGDQSPTVNAKGDVTINYYGANPQAVKALQDKLNLNEKTVQRLLTTLDEKDIQLDQRNQAFQSLAQKYAALEQQLDTYDNDDLVAQQARQALNAGASLIRLNNSC